MSWQAGSALVVTLAALAGMLWYEHRRPSTKLIALVAALAALAVAARVLFAAVPNVQGTTDVALLAGYVLGPAPGFMVGALAALASNLFLGQGPWTPWQMLGWGAAGLGGALLAALAGRRLGRWPLAIACGFAGLAFGAWMDLFTLTSFAAQTSADGYLAIAALSLPFNLAHAIGNVLLCLAFGPSFVRVLERFSVPAARALAPAARAARAQRRDVHRRARAVGRGWPARRPPRLRRAPSATGCATSSAPRTPTAGSAARRGRGRASSSPVGRCSAWRRPAVTRWTCGAAAGLRSTTSAPGPPRCRRPGSWSARSSRCAARASIRAASAGATCSRTSSASGGRTDRSGASPTGRRSGSCPCARAGARPRSTAVRRAAGWLARQQNADGGFSFATRGGGSFVDETGAALQGLAAAGRRRGRPVARAVAYLRKAQNEDGGFGQTEGYRSNSQSTAWAAQGIVAAGRAPAGFRRGGRSPLRYLETLQQSDGSFRYSRSSAQTPVWVTAQVVAALRRKPFPVREPVRERRVRQTAEPAAVRKPQTKVVKEKPRRSRPVRVRPVVERVVPRPVAAHLTPLPRRRAGTTTPASRCSSRSARSSRPQAPRAPTHYGAAAAPNPSGVRGFSVVVRPKSVSPLQ